MRSCERASLSEVVTRARHAPCAAASATHKKEQEEKKKKKQ